MCGKFTSVDHIFAVCPSFSCHSSQTITEYPKYFVLKNSSYFCIVKFIKKQLFL